MDSKIITWFLLMFSLITSDAQAQKFSTLGLEASSLFSLQAKVDKLDPFFGGNFSVQRNNWKANIFSFFGKAKMEELDGFHGLETDFQSNDIIFGISVDYLIINPESRPKSRRRYRYRHPTFSSGLIAGVGVGYFHEFVKFEGDITIDFGYGFKSSSHFEEDLSADSFSINGLLGYQFGKWEINTRYFYLIESKNVTGALNIGISFRFDKPF